MRHESGEYPIPEETKTPAERMTDVKALLKKQAVLDLDIRDVPTGKAIDTLDFALKHPEKVGHLPPEWTAEKLGAFEQAVQAYVKAGNLARLEKIHDLRTTIEEIVAEYGKTKKRAA